MFRKNGLFYKCVRGVVKARPAGRIQPVTVYTPSLITLTFRPGKTLETPNPAFRLRSLPTPVLEYTGSNGRMIDELERIWKEVTVVQKGYYTGISLKGLRKATKNVSHGSQCLGRDLNRAPLHCGSAALPLDGPRRMKQHVFQKRL
jgi:hypothetical protein